MFPAVVIDLGAQATPAEAAWVLDSCNAAIVSGSCELDTTASEPARALAIVRWLGKERGSVRIEVGLREAERGAWSVRELDFAAGDPARERWRSVGLVLATLVGEVRAAGEQRERAATLSETPSTLAAPSTKSSAAAVSAPQPAEAAAQPTEAPARAAATPTSSAPAEPKTEPATDTRSVWKMTPTPLELPVVRPTSFVAFGVLAGQGSDVDPLRWGGGVRGGWISPDGWVLSGAGEYSRSALDENTVQTEWFRIAAGAGYRHWWTERWSAELGVELGARVLRVVPNEDGSIQSTVWSPQAALHGETWWQAFSSAGAWLGLTASSIGRETRLLGPEGETEAVVPLIELQAVMGIWWAP